LVADLRQANGGGDPPAEPWRISTSRTVVEIHHGRSRPRWLVTALARYAARVTRPLIAVLVVIALTASGCRTTATYAYSYPQGNPNNPGDCANQCSAMAQTDGRDAFVSCIKSCPGVSERDGSCGDQSQVPGFGCVDEEHTRIAIGRTVVLAVIVGAIVIGGAAVAAAYGATRK
jgi:hypothetical protein